MQAVVGSVRRRARRDAQGTNTPEASARASRRSSGTSSVDTRTEAATKDKKKKKKSSYCNEITRGLLHLVFIVVATLGVVIGFEYHMMHFIEWEHAKVQEPKLMSYFGGSFMTKDFDCSILARRCYMAKTRLRTCFVPAFICNTMLRPDMFPTSKRKMKMKKYYVNARHVTSGIDLIGKKTEIFNTFHDTLTRKQILPRLLTWNATFTAPHTNSKGMPRDNQLFFIPWELRDQEAQHERDFTYIDMNMDDVPDCVQPRVNTDVGRRDWIASFNAKKDEVPEADSDRHRNQWTRETTQQKDRFRVDTVPGFSGALVKKIVQECMTILDEEIAHQIRGVHHVTDDIVLLTYRHVLLHALRNPFLLLFDEEEWRKQMRGEEEDGFDPEKPVIFDDLEKYPALTNASNSISFLFAATMKDKTTKIPDTLAVTISEGKAKLGGKDFDLNVPIRISNGLTTTEIVSSSSGERAFHANIIVALRVMLRLRLYSKPDFNDVLHIPMAFYSMEEKKMVFDRYDIQTKLRGILCKKIEQCATPYDQNSIDWQRRFNGTTAIQFHGQKKAIMSRVDTTQDKSNYAVGF